MDFKFCLLAGGRPGHLLAQESSDHLIIYLRMRTGRDDVIGAIFSNLDLAKKPSWHPGKDPLHFEF